MSCESLRKISKIRLENLCLFIPLISWKNIFYVEAWQEKTCLGCAYPLSHIQTKKLANWAIACYRFFFPSQCFGNLELYFCQARPMVSSACNRSRQVGFLRSTNSQQKVVPVWRQESILFFSLSSSDSIPLKVRIFSSTCNIIVRPEMTKGK